MEETKEKTVMDRIRDLEVGDSILFKREDARWQSVRHSAAIVAYDSRKKIRTHKTDDGIVVTRYE